MPPHTVWNPEFKWEYMCISVQYIWRAELLSQRVSTFLFLINTATSQTPEIVPIYTLPLIMKVPISHLTLNAAVSHLSFLMLFSLIRHYSTFIFGFIFKVTLFRHAHVKLILANIFECLLYVRHCTHYLILFVQQIEDSRFYLNFFLCF